MTKMIRRDVDYFKNPEKLPIDLLDLFVESNGEKQLIPALSKYWMENKYFLYYEVPKIHNFDGSEIIGAKDRWLEAINYILKDLDWLLCLPFHRFWSNIIHNKSIINSLVLFLQNSPTFYTYDRFPNDGKMRESLEDLRHKVLIVFARIVTNKESPEAYITPQTHGELLYKEFLITAPIMMDLCQLYGRENQKIVERILQSAIKAQPGYETDLHESIDFIGTLLTTTEQNYEQSDMIYQSTIEEIEIAIIELLDISTNAEIILKIYPQSVEYFCNDLFLTRLVSVYGNMIPEIYKRLYALGYNEDHLIKFTELKHFLDVTRIEFLKVFRSVSYKDITWILEQPDPTQVDDAQERVEQFLKYLSIALSEKIFVKDYQRFYSVIDDLDLVSQITSQIDTTKIDHLINLVKIVTNEEPTKPPIQVPQNFGECSNGQSSASSFPKASSVSTKIQKTEDELLSLIGEVKQILCDLGEGFIERCLKYYNDDQYAVINAYCEGNLPPELSELDQTLPYIPQDPQEKSANVDKTLGFERLNIFDGDEFDVMTQDKIDKSKVHRGKKKDEYKNFNELMNDKSFKKDLGDVYQRYGIINDEYEDEYDDTYESLNIGVPLVDDAQEMDKPFTTPRVLRVNDKSNQPEEEEEQEEDSGQDQRNGFNFCQDPAVLRAKAEERRQLKYGGSRGGDVAGRPKGQGNDKEVLINRDKKNTNKATRANHNRRFGADKKRRGGMVPS